MNMEKNQILSILKNVQDPELQRDIVSLGMVKELSIHNGEVFIHLELPAGSTGLRETLTKAIREALEKSFPTVEVTVQVSQPVRSGAAQPKAAGPQPFGAIRHVIAVASGKGGVGKTTAAVNLALALHKRGAKVGLMDGDIYGPNVPLMLGISNETRPSVDDQDKLIPIEAQGLKMISMGVLVPADQPMIWRGPMLHSAVTQFVQKVNWGELDFLLVDLPPGTGDVQISLAQVVPLAGAVIITTPQEVALMDVRKGVAMFRKTNVPILGVIENMTGEIFGSGGGRKAAEQFGVPFLGEIPLDKRVRENGDQGSPIVLSHPDSEAAKAFMQAAQLLESGFTQKA
ncbi:MAG: Mrp/NBP35 family ATP-binding protein [Candidatus Omnitrophica bacterium]|nr:Mrp/NBP35 family ATP-binding protein [Candidatus Omnitrophota bacterium]